MIVFSIGVAVAIEIALVLLLRSLSSRDDPRIGVIAPANTHALVATKNNTSGEGGVNNDGGNITNVIHAIPGSRLIKEGTLDEWHYVDGEEPRGILFRLLGIQFIWFFRYLRVNDVRTFRYGRSDKGDKYEVSPKTHHTRYRFYSGQHDIQMIEVETKGILKVDLLLNLLVTEKYPVRVATRVADPYAVLTLMVTKFVIKHVGSEDANQLVEDKKIQKVLLEEIEQYSEVVEKEIGLSIKKANLSDIRFDKETAALMEKKKRAEMEGDAKITEAEKQAKAITTIANAEKQARMAINEADAHRVNTVYLPLGQNAAAVAARGYEAYENNKTVRTYAPGQAIMPTLPLSTEDEKEEVSKG